MAIEIKVNGKKFSIDLEQALCIVDISMDMDNVASQMAFWGGVWASAEQEAAESDAYYRRWRASEGREIINGDTKLSEWKVRQIIESSDEFHKIKRGISKAQENVIVAKTIYEAFRVKANMLQSKGAMMRAELDSTSMRTSPSRTEPRTEQESKKKAMKEIFRAKKR